MEYSSLYWLEPVRWNFLSLLSNPFSYKTVTERFYSHTQTLAGVA
jgi:hypothetical protein